MHPHAFPHSVGAVSSWQDMQPGLQEVRQHGMACAIDQPIAGVSAFAVPVFDYNSHIAIALTVIGPTGGFEPDGCCDNARILKEVAADISVRLGSSQSASMP